MWRLLACCCAAFALAACGSDPAASGRDAGYERPPGSTPPSGHNWTRFGWDAARSNASADPTGITAENLGSLQRQQVRLEGTVDASPIYLSGVSVGGRSRDLFVVTTTYGKTIGVDADDGSVLWTYTPAAYSSWAGSYRITNATPVADPDRRSIYAASPDGHIEKIDVADGRAAWSTAITRNPDREKIAGAVNYWNGHVITTTGGYIGDAPPYQGHIAILDAGTGRIEHVWNALCSDRLELLDPRSCNESGSAIWGRAGAVVDPQTGHLLVATGNGRWDGHTMWGDAAIELDADATHLVANYTPSNTTELDDRDQDLGSTSPALLGRGVVAQGGKDGRIRLLNLQQISGVAPHRGGEQQAVPTPSGEDLFTAPAVLHSGGTTWMFAADAGGTAAWTFNDGRLEQRWRNRHGGTSPIVAGGLVYVYDPRGSLRVYEAETGRELKTLDCGGGHWNSPIVVDGRIALPEGSANAHRTSGVLNIWRLPR